MVLPSTTADPVSLVSTVAARAWMNPPVHVKRGSTAQMMPPLMCPTRLTTHARWVLLPGGNGLPYGCDPGTYQASEGKIDCDDCPAGKYCMYNTSVPYPCPPYSFCPEGSIEPTPCPNGTYTEDSVTDLQRASQCSPCPAGKYCLSGRVDGPCNAGYLCYSGSDTPTPDGSEPLKGELCPFGYYCLEGATNVSVCPVGEVIDKRGASSQSDCGGCPAGYNCPPGIVVPQLCDPGFYCQVNEAMQPCPLYTWSDSVGATNLSTCEPCPGGFVCNMTGMSDYTIRPCPVAHYCPEPPQSHCHVQLVPTGTPRRQEMLLSAGHALLASTVQTIPPM
ncbi:signal peptide, CUB and EGF-like domain-containing protein 1 isoform X1 [Ptychodera flava]|uniref:signal peptide, CUB and EGF-like domain-containing protein 1 isoform X1 n=1 Tax=Ptychodera flava TaxID=63121 RepID=UPI00396A2D64